MPITKPQARQLRVAIKELISAELNLQWKQDIEGFKLYSIQVNHKWRVLNQLIDKLTGRKKDVAE